MDASLSFSEKATILLYSDNFKVTFWDVIVVMDYFRQWKDNTDLSLKELSMKTATLVALVSAQRVQSVHKLHDAGKGQV